MLYSQHPNPLLERAHWRDLGGSWRFTFDDRAAWTRPDQVVFDHQIEVPFAPESALGGLEAQGYHPVVWYGYTLHLTPYEQQAARLRLHFGAVDYQCWLWVDGQQVAHHQGGHTPFFVDLPGAGAGPLDLVLRVADDPHDLHKPRGKQDWLPQPHSIWYPRTTGIWQPVWLEPLPETYLAALDWTSSVEQWSLQLEASLGGPQLPDLKLRVALRLDGEVLCDDTYRWTGERLGRQIVLADPGIDDARARYLWSPEHPQLIQAELTLYQGDRILDRVHSYTALRSLAVDQGRFLLNGRPYPLRLVLDQGYWPQGLMTATDQQLRRDVELARLLGFNGVRKHQKLENRRWLYWADVLGLLVWVEMPSAYAFSAQTVQRLTGEWMEIVQVCKSHPSVMAWVPFNESWGVPDLPLRPDQRQFVRALYHLTRSLDATRPVSANDGWEQPVGDLFAIHDYTADPQVLQQRYGSAAALEQTAAQIRPAGRWLGLEGFGPQGRPAMLTEFGGIAFSAGDGWGYSRASDSTGFLEHYTALLRAVHASTVLSGFCYTQLTDTFQEKNGLLYADRTPKAELAELARATRGWWDAENPMGYARRWLQHQQAQLSESTLPI